MPSSCTCTPPRKVVFVHFSLEVNKSDPKGVHVFFSALASSINVLHQCSPSFISQTGTGWERERSNWRMPFLQRCSGWVLTIWVSEKPSCGCGRWDQAVIVWAAQWSNTATICTGGGHNGLFCWASGEPVDSLLAHDWADLWYYPWRLKWNLSKL